jgi:hypothetical protein
MLEFALTWAMIARVTRFITVDVLAQPLRDRVAVRFGPESRLAYLVGCGWCASVWVSVVFVSAGLVWAGTWWWQWAGLVAAASYAYGLVASRVDT